MLSLPSITPSPIRHNLTTSCSLFSLLTSSLVDENLVRYPFILVNHVRGSSCLMLFAGLPCFHLILVDYMSEASSHLKPPIALLPNLYEETGIDPASIRTVQLGPWTYKVDDGSRNTESKHGRLRIRPCIPWYVSPSLQMLFGPHNSARSQLETCLAELNLHKFFGRVVPGLSNDPNEIKVISHMTLKCTCRGGSTTGRGDSSTQEDYDGRNCH